MLHDLDFSDLAPIELLVVGPDRKNYVLREASADTAVKYRNASAKAGKWVDGKLSGFENVADADPLLVALCLCETEGGRAGTVLLKRDGNPVTVPLALVLGWSDRVVKTLFERVKVISPMLIKDDTREELMCQRDEINKKLDEMDKGKDKEGDADPKAPPPDGGDSST